MGYMMDGTGFGFGYGLVGLLFSIVIIIGVVLLVVWAVRQFSANGQNSSIPRQSDGTAQPLPREIVEKRYAHGELTREQYQEMLSDLS
jgi:putative membrane protein